jgi:hypothetical protein
MGKKPLPINRILGHKRDASPELAHAAINRGKVVVLVRVCAGA